MSYFKQTPYILVHHLTVFSIHVLTTDWQIRFLSTNYDLLEQLRLIHTSRRLTITVAFFFGANNYIVS